MGLELQPSADPARRIPRRDDPRMYTAEFSALTSADLREAGIDPNTLLPVKIAPELSFKQGFLWVALGGALGGLMRYLVGLRLPTLTSFTLVDIPWGTLLINIIGCLLVGILAGFTERRPGFDARLKLAIGTGFCGGFTTLSAFALENAVLFGSNHSLLAMEYMAASTVFCLLAVCLGFWIGKKLPIKSAKETGKPGILSAEAQLFEVPSKPVSSLPEQEPK